MRLQSGPTPIEKVLVRVEALENRVAALEANEPYTLTPKGKFVTDLMSDGISYGRALDLADQHFKDNLP